MAVFLLIVLFFGALYAIKGGQHKKWRIYLEHKAGIEHDAQGHPIGGMSIPQWFVHRLLDGKVLSALLFATFFTAVTFGRHEWWFFLVAMGLWLVAVAPRMGRIVGMIGGYKGNWDENENPYSPLVSGTMAVEGFKQGLQRGVFMGAMMSLLFWNPLLIIFGALYPLTAWSGVSIEQRRTGIVAAPWQWHELICGAVCFGLPIAIII